MRLRSWLLRKVNGITTRGDLPRSPVLGAGAVEGPSVIRHDARRSETAARREPAAPHLGPYAPLVAAIREELEDFVVSHLRLHLAIAERDRYLLTSIDVRAAAPEDAELLRRFAVEFKPEQVKRYLAKEIIGGLPNASAIDLSQFAGLNAERAQGDGEDAEDDDYSELLAELSRARPAAGARRFEVGLIGRWSEAAAGAPARPAMLATPLGAGGAAIAIEDAGGRRQLVLAAAPGRRYAIGKGEGCDVVVNGVFASRRHCEIFFDGQTWRVTDTGSTNGIRVERGGSVLGRSAAPPTGEAAVIEVVPGAEIVLSAHAEGSAADYPRLSLAAVLGGAASRTPIASAVGSPATPSTPIVPARARPLVMTVRMASGTRTVAVGAETLPFSVGRSRNQALVIDWAHEGVSGHHLDIVAVEPGGATVVVHGDNGVALGATSYPPGSRLSWKPGESLVLGRVIGHEPECRLTLAREA